MPKRRTEALLQPAEGRGRKGEPLLQPLLAPPVEDAGGRGSGSQWRCHAAEPHRPLVDEKGELNIELHGYPKLKLYAGDLFHTLVNVPNSRFYLVLIGTYCLLFGLFALVYHYEAWNNNCIPGVYTYTHAVWFSVQTAMTIGYGGDLTPDPTCLLTNVAVAAQSVASLLAAYSLLGLVYARFSRPSRRVSTVVFSHKMVLHEDNGVPRLACRVANLRKHQLIEVTVRMLVALDNVMTEEHESIFRFTAVPVPGSSQVFLGLPFTIAHPVTSSSPLYGMSCVMMERCDMEILVLLEGTDASTSARIQARHSYRASDIMYNHRFVTMVTRLPNGLRCVDFTLFHAVVPVPSKKAVLSRPPNHLSVGTLPLNGKLPPILQEPTALRSDGVLRSGYVSSDDGSEGGGRQRRRTEVKEGDAEEREHILGDSHLDYSDRPLRTRTRRFRDREVFRQKQRSHGERSQAIEDGAASDSQGMLIALEELDQEYVRRLSAMREKANLWRQSTVELAARIRQSRDLQGAGAEAQSLLSSAEEALKMAFEAHEEERRLA